MNAAGRIGAFAAALAVVFGAAAAVGAALDPLREDGQTPAHGPHGHAGDDDAHGVAHEAAGLAVEQDGVRLAVEKVVLPRNRTAELAFRIVGADGAPITRFDVEHTRRMHLIVVRRDLTGYQHLHPRMDGSGRWTIRMRLGDAGSYRAYADFSADGRAYTLATDLSVEGPFVPTPLAPARPRATSAGYAVILRARDVAAEMEADLDYALTGPDGRPVTPEPYLGADGHLVALREGDLAFVHVHPEPSDRPGTIRFRAPLPSPGRYRLFLQFRDDGAIRTVAQTLEVPK